MKIKSLTLYVIFSIVALLVYTVVSQIVFIRTGAEYSTLTGCFYGAFGGEILMCGLIKIFKLKEKDNDSSNCVSSSGDMLDSNQSDCGSNQKDIRG